MALIPLVEIYTPDINTLKAVTQSRKITESELKTISDSLSTMKLSESTKKYFEDHPVATLEGKTVWRFPVSRYDFLNDNNRYYEKRLWERVINEQREAYQGNVGLADHPKDDDAGSFKEQAIVWLAMGLDESNKVVWAEGIFVGPHGRLAEEILEAGGKVGFSTSGFGELEEGNKSKVRWDSYQLERPADLVLNPSQKVYGRYDMKVPKNKDGITHEATETKNNGKEELKENTPMSTEVKLSKLEERKFRRDVGVFLEEASKITDPQERLGQLNEILAYFAEGIAPDLKKEVETKVNEAKVSIEKAIKEHTKLVETFGVDNVDQVKEGIKKVAVDTQLFERDASEWKQIAEGLQDKVQKLNAIIATRPTVEAYKTSLAFSTRMKETFKSKETELLNTIKELQIKIKKQSLIEEQMIKELANISGDNKKLKEYSSKLYDYSVRMREKVLEFKAQAQAEQEVFNEEKEAKARIAVEPVKHSNEMFENFNENSDVKAYYKDLIRRHGTAIEPFKEKILSSKTLNEAMKRYIDIMAELDSDKTSRITDALDPEERQKIIESQTNSRIKVKSDFEKRLPEGWE